MEKVFDIRLQNMFQYDTTRIQLLINRREPSLTSKANYVSRCVTDRQRLLDARPSDGHPAPDARILTSTRLRLLRGP